MPRAEIASKQALFTLTQLHAELGGKMQDNKRAALKIRTAMLQVEAVLQMLQPGFSVAAIAAKRRLKSNPWFKRGTLYRGALDVLRRATAPMTSRQIADALIADKAPQLPGSRLSTYRPHFSGPSERSGGTDWGTPLNGGLV